MSKIQKSNMTVDGKNIHMSMPFAKVDKENRLVSGWATLDNIDTQGDIVLADASVKAFARARGNIREMHQPLAVGRMVDFVEKEYFDESDSKLYRGIFVTARVSKGAEDTWEKVLDGTLAGFSIGGEVKEVSNEFVKDAGKTVRFIKDYDLVELSLVDNPANQLANIHSFQKSVFSINKTATGSVTVEGMVADTKIENVFICSTDDELVVVNTEESETCPQCGTKMENAGWFESGVDRAEKVQSIIAKFRDPAAKEAAPISDEGGVEMGHDVNKAQNSPVPEGKEVSSPNPAEAKEAGDVEAVASVEAEAEKPADVDETEGTGEVAEGEEPAVSPEEVTDESTEISKKIDALHKAVKDSLEESKTATDERVAQLEQKMKDSHDEFIAKFSEIEHNISGFSEKVEAQKQRLASLESTLEKYNSSDALRKSADVTPAVQTVQNNGFWDGAFS